MRSQSLLWENWRESVVWSILAERVKLANTTKNIFASIIQGLMEVLNKIIRHLPMEGTLPMYGKKYVLLIEQIVVADRFAIKVPEKFEKLEAVAPLFCAGITTYSPLRRYQDKVIGKVL